MGREKTGNSIAIPAVQVLPIDKLKPWKGNPRVGHAVDAIVKSIETFGYTQPIIIQKKTRRILAGHGRLQALKKMGEKTAPCIELDISDDQADLYTIVDNRLVEAGDWDYVQLSKMLKGIEQANIDALLVLSKAELALIHSKGRPADPGQEDDIPPAPDGPAKSQRGDEWMLGDHRIVCGDSTSKADFAHLMGTNAALVFTDPPYGVDYQSGAHDKIKNDALKDDALWKFLKTALGLAAKYSSQDAAFYIWHASSTREEFAQAMKAVGLIERQYLIWVKPSITLGHADYPLAARTLLLRPQGRRQPDVLRRPQPSHGVARATADRRRRRAQRRGPRERRRPHRWRVRDLPPAEPAQGQEGSPADGRAREGHGDRARPREVRRLARQARLPGHPPHPEARRARPPRDREQQQERRHRPRPLPGQRLHPHRLRGDRSAVPRPRVLREVRRRHRAEVAAFYWKSCGQYD